jgi:hypothetical protein
MDDWSLFAKGDNFSSSSQAGPVQRPSSRYLELFFLDMQEVGADFFSSCGNTRLGILEA